jgi:hypothetical protein
MGFRDRTVEGPLQNGRDLQAVASRHPPFAPVPLQGRLELSMMRFHVFFWRTYSADCAVHSISRAGMFSEINVSVNTFRIQSRISCVNDALSFVMLQ